MFKIDIENNRLIQLDKKSFGELGFKERQHLQEWIADNPATLGEELLVIQKEFSGFDDTYERLDLLALDKDGKLVVIENKLDDSGRDVTWQALKYASYCSTLTQKNIIDIYQRYIGSEANAEQKIKNFLDGELDILNKTAKPRIILVAANFKKEVTSTVLWLLGYDLDIKCYKAIPYKMDETLFIHFDQIIPTKDTEEFVIRMADKARENSNINETELQNRHLVRIKFWEYLLPKLKGKTHIFQSNNPTKDNTLYAGGTDITYGSYIFIITSTYCTIALKFYRAVAEENKYIFDELYKYKEEIEHKFGNVLNWDKGLDTKQSIISYSKTGVNVFDENDWENMSGFLVENIVQFEKAFRDYLPRVKKLLVQHLNAAS